MNLLEYVLRLELRYKQFETAKIEYPAFNVVSIERDKDDVITVVVDDIRAIAEAGRELGDGGYAYAGMFFYEQKKEGE